MDYQSRVEKLQRHLEEKNVDALIIENCKDLFYFTGISVTAGALLVDKEEAHLFVDSRYFEVCRKTSPFPTSLSDKKALFKHLAQNGTKTLAFDSAYCSYQRFLQLEKDTSNEGITLCPWEKPTRNLRSIKDQGEISIMRQAADLACSAYEHARSCLKEGISEEEIAFELETHGRKLGAQRLAFDVNVSFGANSSMPHHRAGKTRLKANDIVLMDLGLQFDKYNSDMTRVCFVGDPDPKLKEIYEIVLEAQIAAVEGCKAGVTFGELDLMARNVISSAGYGEEFSHSLGHGIGLEVHEFPVLRSQGEWKDQALEEGMIITIEPGIYLAGIGGVRIEDAVVVKKDGCENLTRTSKELCLCA